MVRSRRFLVAFMIALVLSLGVSRLRAQVVYSGWFYEYGWYWPFSYCFWTYTDYGNGNWWYEDDCGNSYGYLNLN